jgi:excisionase family DNA binding protein
LTVEEAAAMLGMTRGALYALCARGQIPHRKRGTRLVFLERELQAYIAALEGLTFEEWEEARAAGMVTGSCGLGEATTSGMGRLRASALLLHFSVL